MFANPVFITPGRLKIYLNLKLYVNVHDSKFTQVTAVIIIMRDSMGLSVWREPSKKLTVRREKGKKLTVCRELFLSR